MNWKSVCIILSLLLLIITATSGYYYTVSRSDYNRLLVDLNTSQSLANANQVRADTLQSDLAKTQGELAKALTLSNSLQTNLDSTQTKLKQVQGEVDGAVSGREKARDEMAAAQSETLSLQRRLVRLRFYAEIVNALFVPSLNGELARMPSRQTSELLITLQGKVDAAGDPQMQVKFKAVKDSNMAEGPMRDLMLYVFKAIPAT